MEPSINHHLIRGILLILLFPTLFQLGLGQQPNSCGTEYANHLLDANDPETKRRRDQMEKAYQGQMASFQTASKRSVSCDKWVIPVVVHIVYDNPTSNISDAQVHSQIEALNRDFRRYFNTPAYGDGADTGIEFCLASRDPNGQPTTGITRTESPLSNHDMTTDGAALKSLVRWFTRRYLNIWVVRTIESDSTGIVAGYATLPGASASQDGIVVRQNYFGTVGTVQASDNLGRTTTHEVGHYLGLRHVFYEGCQGNTAADCAAKGDRVCDTPQQKDPVFGCLDPDNSCQEEGCEEFDPYKNYMGYIDGNCMNNFSQGQVNRMHFFLTGSRFHLTLPSNLQVTGCNNYQPANGRPRAAFTADRTTVCVGESISYTDLSDGCLDEWEWIFPGGIPTQSADQHPTVMYPTPGQYVVQLTVSNADSSDVLTRLFLVEVVNGAMSPILNESFEGAFPPAGWRVWDHDIKSTWSQSNGGSQGNNSVSMGHFLTHSDCTFDDLISPTFTLGNVGAVSLAFDYAYRIRNADFTDRLEVSVSTDCGGSFDIPLFDKSGTSLATVPGAMDSNPFSPGPGDWRSAVVDLTDYLGENTVRFRFRTEGQGGQNLYIDNVRLQMPVGVEAQIPTLGDWEVFPNPFRERFSVFVSSKKSKILQVSLLDLKGKEVLSTSNSLEKGQNTCSIETPDLSTLPSGIYLLQMESEGITQYKKVMKQ